MRQLSSREISAVSGGTFNFDLTNPCAPIPYVLGFFGGVLKLLLTGKLAPASTCTTCGGGTTPPPNYN